MTQYFNSWLRAIENNTSKEFYACTLRWMKEKGYFFNIKHNEEFSYSNAKNLVQNYADYRLFFLIYLCDAHNNGSTTGWGDFFEKYFTIDDFKKYFSSLKTDELKTFAQQYVMKHNGNLCHKITIGHLTSKLN